MNRFYVSALLFATSTTLLANTLDNLAIEIASRNKAYSIEELKNKAETAELKTANNLNDPEIEFGNVWNHNGGIKLGVEISQSFDWPGAYKARAREAEVASQAMRYLNSANRSELLLRTKQSLIDLINARKKMDLYKSAVCAVDSLAEIVKRDVDKKEISVLDGNKLKIEHIAFMRKYNKAVEDYNRAYGDIMDINNGEQCSDILAQLTDYPIETRLRPVEQYLKEATEANPDLRYQSSLQELNKAKAKVIHQESLPGFSIGLRHEYEEGENFTGFSFSMTLPIFSKRGKKAANELMIQSAELSSGMIAAQCTARVENEYAAAKRLASEISRYEGMFTSADHIRLLDKAFEARHINTLDYISDLIYFTDAAADYYDLEYSYQLQLASLERYSASIE